VKSGLIGGISLAVGYVLGSTLSPSTASSRDGESLVVPSGLPRACCEDVPPPPSAGEVTFPEDRARRLGDRLRGIVGAENVLDGTSSPPSSSALQRYTKGARLGSGTALFVVTPRRLVEVVDCVQAIVDAGCVVLPQGQNTGLTGGSVPHSQDTTRPTVVLSTIHLNRIFPIDNGKRVVCLAGAGLAQLQEFLSEHFPDRESHSTLGSTFLNPTTAAGVAFGSGGTQLRKGPAYTERALYLKVTTNKWKENVVEVVNTLGVEGIVDRDLPKERVRKMDGAPYILDTWSRWIYEQGLRDMKYSDESKHGTAPAHDVTYRDRVCRCTDTVSRFNADTRGPDPNRSEGKVVILATVHDTFEKPKRTRTLWVAMDSLDTALELRRRVCLDNPHDLPVSAEYLNQDSYDVIDQSSRLMTWSIRWLGPSSPLVRKLWNVKLYVEALPLRGADGIVDRFLYFVNPFVPSALPRAVRGSVERGLCHHVALKVGDFGDGEMDRVLGRLEAFAAQNGSDRVQVHDCSDQDAALTAFRFVAAPAFRTWCIGKGQQGISVDYALPLNRGQEPNLSDGGTPEQGGEVATPLKRMRYSHFGCNVVHEDLAYPPGVDVHKAKHHLKAIVESQCKGRLPAEHGHGTEYVAPRETQERWKRMDPLNVLNPGIGGMSPKYRYQ
jgi:D-lactate dehydrogenase